MGLQRNVNAPDRNTEQLYLTISDARKRLMALLYWYYQVLNREIKIINRLNLSVERNTILRNCFNAHGMIGSKEKGKTEEQLSIVYVVHVVPAELL